MAGGCRILLKSSWLVTYAYVKYLLKLAPRLTTESHSSHIVYGIMKIICLLHEYVFCLLEWGDWWLLMLWLTSWCGFAVLQELLLAINRHHMEISSRSRGQKYDEPITLGFSLHRREPFSMDTNTRQTRWYKCQWEYCKICLERAEVLLPPSSGDDFEVHSRPTVGREECLQDAKP